MPDARPFRGERAERFAGRTLCSFRMNWALARACGPVAFSPQGTLGGRRSTVVRLVGGGAPATVPTDAADIQSVQKA